MQEFIIEESVGFATMKLPGGKDVTVDVYEENNAIYLLSQQHKEPAAFLPALAEHVKGKLGLEKVSHAVALHYEQCIYKAVDAIKKKLGGQPDSPSTSPPLTPSPSIGANEQPYCLTSNPSSLSSDSEPK